MSGAEPGVPAKRSQAFRERAMLEADRYGPDPWIFVRELLQNSRDAGGSAVDFTVGSDQQTEWVCCYDDGEGMTFEHARRYLFALYASSKEDNSKQAGKFGVGFWSVLRFSPIAITIRSRPRAGAAWGLRLDGSLEHAEHVTPPERFGTEIVLTRALGDGRLEHRIFDAVRQSARYLRMRDQPERPLPIRISGRLANEDFGLPAPSASFRRKHVRGVVGLGSAPRVELFSRGLRVRSSACLEDLAAPSGRHTSRMRVQFPELPGGLAPTALLESDALEVMLSRSDARDNRALTKLVRLAQKELERLIDSQLAHSRPQPWWRRGWDRASSGLRNSLAARTMLGAGLGAVAAVGISLWLWGSPTGVEAGEGDPSRPVAGGGADTGPQKQKAYADLGERYRGPRVDVLAPGSAEPVDLRYAPDTLRLHFAALTFPTLSPDGSPVHESIATADQIYVTADGDAARAGVSLPVSGTGRPMRIPVPTGHRIVTDTVRLDGTILDVRASAEGHPVVTIPAGTETFLEYQTAPETDPAPVGMSARLPDLPPSLRELTRGLEREPIAERVRVLLSTVHAEVLYDRSSEMALRHTQAVQRGQGFIERTLAIGAGDCDVQNGLLVALLQSAGVRSRLAVGYIGVGGSVLPWLHAWAEYLGDDGLWHVLDASERSAAAQGSAIAVAAPPAPAGAPTSERDPSGASSASGGTPAPADPTSPTEVDDAAGSGGAPPVAETAVPPEREPPTAVGSVAAGPPRSPPPGVDDTLRARLVALEAEHPWLLPTGTGLLLLLALWGLLRGRTFRDVNLDDSTDLSRLLQGVLQQPAAFSHMASLFHRPLVPLIDGQAMSLQRTRDLATKGRLYRTSARPQLAMRAAKNGAAVLDCQTAEGRTVADAVGAVDLDAWAELFDRAWTDALANAINTALRGRKEPWRVRIGSRVPGRLASLDLSPLGVRLPGDPAQRLVLVEAGTAWWDEAAAAFARNPRTAVFGALDQLAERLDLPEERRAPLLAEGAKAALLETYGA
ncbi:MAG: ATP-binding protein [Myxococcota bacterium]